MYAVQINGFNTQKEAKLFIEWYRRYGEAEALDSYGTGPNGEELTGGRFPQLYEPTWQTARVPDDTEVAFIEMKY